VAVITGASTGIGLATAKRFAQEGIDHVFISGRRKDALDRAVEQIGKNVTSVQGDIANMADLDRLYQAVRRNNRKIDVISQDGQGRFRTEPFERYQRFIAAVASPNLSQAAGAGVCIRHSVCDSRDVPVVLDVVQLTLGVDRITRQSAIVRPDRLSY
jgi:NAD(P)-dependent dehydrogenase (short-subunit alcohol dehydrogenase family)